MRASLTDLELFWHNKKINMPNLIKIAISHYQFETIHPFNDGNGRIGRMLITLSFIELGLYKNQHFIFQIILKEIRVHIMMLSLFVRDHNDMDQWIIFFLSAVIKQQKKQKYF